MSDTQDVYRITVLPPVHRWAGVCPVYRALWFFGLSICLGLRGLFGRYWWVCHSWWASVGLLIFELLVGVLWDKWKGTYKSWMLTTSTWKKKKRENFHSNLTGKLWPWLQQEEKVKTTCFPEVQRLQWIQQTWGQGLVLAAQNHLFRSPTWFPSFHKWDNLSRLAEDSVLIALGGCRDLCKCASSLKLQDWCLDAFCRGHSLVGQSFPTLSYWLHGQSMGMTWSFWQGQDRTINRSILAVQEAWKLSPKETSSSWPQ